MAQFTRYPYFPMISGTENQFSPITKKVSTLRHMLLRKSYINMPIAQLLHFIRRIYHVPIKS